ncbi:unnamed protein product, partial [Ectocarpus sp. 8 AP-2014]
MTPRRQQQQQQRQGTAEGSTTARNPSAPSRSRLQGSRAACSLLTAAAVAAVTAPLTAEAWVSHAAARSSRQAQTLGWTGRGSSGHNRCQVQRQRGSDGGDRESSQLSGRGVSGRRRRVVSCRSQAVDEASSTAEYKPMEEGDEVLIDFDESEFDESEDFFAVEGEEEDGEDEGEDDSTSGPVQVIGVEEAMDRVRELKKLGPPVPVKGERARSKRRFPVVAVIGRPNVGKSTVVNRLAKRFKDGSIVFDESGVTRDRTYKRAWYCGKDFDVVDT